MDMVEAFARQVTAPALAKARRLRTDAHFKDWKHQKIRMNGDLTHIGQKLAKDLLLGGRSLGAILELSVEWHGKQAGIDAAIEAISPGMLDLRRWEAGLPDWDVDGIRIKVLTTLRELHDEGRRGKNTDGSEGLWHCVAGYASKCTGSRTRIVSLRKCVADGTEVRLSTAEINLDSEDYKAVVVQHRGLKNAAPPESTVAALAKYMAAISAGRLQVDRVAIEPPRKDSALDGTITEAAGYEWDILGNVEKAISVWSGFLPRGMRAMTAEDLAALAPSWQN
jgi:hypothetical protein